VSEWVRVFERFSHAWMSANLMFGHVGTC